MTAYTLTKNTNLRQLPVAGGYSARTGGDTIAHTNGWSFTIDQDTQYGHGASAFAATSFILGLAAGLSVGTMLGVGIMALVQLRRE